MSHFMPFYKCDECGENVDAKDVTANGFPQKFFCPGCFEKSLGERYFEDKQPYPDLP